MSTLCGLWSIHRPDIGKGANEVIELAGERFDKPICRLAGSRRRRPPIEIEHALTVPERGAMQADRIVPQHGSRASGGGPVRLIRGPQYAGAGDDPLPGPLQLPDLHAGENGAPERPVRVPAVPSGTVWNMD